MIIYLSNINCLIRGKTRLLNANNIIPKGKGVRCEKNNVKTPNNNIKEAHVNVVDCNHTFCHNPTSCRVIFHRAMFTRAIKDYNEHCCYMCPHVRIPCESLVKNLITSRRVVAYMRHSHTCAIIYITCKHLVCIDNMTNIIF